MAHFLKQLGILLLVITTGKWFFLFNQFIVHQLQEIVFIVQCAFYWYIIETSSKVDLKKFFFSSKSQWNGTLPIRQAHPYIVKKHKMFRFFKISICIYKNNTL